MAATATGVRHGKGTACREKFHFSGLVITPVSSQNIRTHTRTHAQPHANAHARAHACMEALGPSGARPLPPRSRGRVALGGPSDERQRVVAHRGELRSAHGELLQPLEEGGPEPRRVRVALQEVPRPLGSEAAVQLLHGLRTLRAERGRVATPLVEEVPGLHPRSRVVQHDDARVEGGRVADRLVCRGPIMGNAFVLVDLKVEVAGNVCPLFVGAVEAG
mmetsp:Transcript_8644/g.27478  ORF Transcript_8644/g.27478 Transcript_8644/m.27478 type:complete len:219 (-) Transcript_8644:1185-1841(-)